MNTRVIECPECDGVMKSTWSDGKTRIHAMECRRCDHRLDAHQGETKYLELRHADLFGILDATEMDFSKFYSEALILKVESTNKAFTPEDSSWKVVSVSRTHEGDEYVVSAYSERQTDGHGVGPGGELPHGQPDVSWSAGRVYVNNSEIHLVPYNDGHSALYFTWARDIEIENMDHPNEIIRISL